MSGTWCYKTVEQRFWDQTQKINNGCIEWIGTITDTGYGMLSVEYKKYYAHRFAFYLATGNHPPKGKYVCHSCDNKKCVNIEHLFVGSPQDNSLDASKKGRLTSVRKLSKDKINKIRELCSRKIMSQRDIAFLMETTQTTVSEIYRNKFKYEAKARIDE